MSYQLHHKQKFEDLDYRLNNLDELRRIANGGNSVLFTYPPNEESLYINKAIELYSSKATFIDISKLFIEFIDKDGIDNFITYYKDFINTPHVIFIAEDDPQDGLFDLIIYEIKKALNENKIPILIRTGCLYGTGIENLKIMQNQNVMNKKLPLIVFYPSKVEDDVIKFLNFKNADKYRCTVIK